MRDGKTGETMWKSLKQKFERSVVAYLVTGKILRSAEIKFKVAGS